MKKKYLELNINQRINVKFYIYLYRCGYVGANKNIYLFIDKLFYDFHYSLWASIPYSLGSGRYVYNKFHYLC